MSYKLKIKNLKGFFLKNEKAFFVTCLFFVFGIGIFLRVFHHQDWLHFQLDQARDATIISNAVRDGAENLPLLGPQASGSELKLGPIFYYFQYLTASVFGDKPHVLAWPDLFFAILSLPLFYFFIRNYFSKWFALGLLAVFSTSIFMVFYARFAWNPNSIPFFMLLLGIGILKMVEERNKYNFLWLYLTFFSVAILGQLHFITFFLAPMVLVSAFIFLKPKIKYGHYLVGMLIFLFLYSPVIYSETKSNWQNSKAFVNTFIQRTEFADARHNIFEKSFRAFQESSRFNLVTIASNQNTDVLNTVIKDKKLDFKCDDSCEKYFPQMIFAWIFLLLGLFSILYKINTEPKDGKKYRFLVLNLIWLAAFFVLLVPLSYKSSPRFFLITAVPFLVIFGTLVKLSLTKISSKRIKGLAVILLFLSLSLLNLSAVVKFFQVERSVISDKDAPELYREIFMPGGERATLLQLKEIANEIKLDAEKNNEKKVYIVADNYYARSIFYLLKYQLDTKTDCYFKLSSYETDFNKTVYYIKTTNSKELKKQEAILKDKKLSFESEKGTFTIYKLEPAKNVLEEKTNFKGCNVF